jgi:hypothetical protein
MDSVYCSHKEGYVPIVIDTGASVSVAPVLTDFIGPLRPCATANLKGLSGSTEVIGEGTVNWLVRDVFGNKRKIRTTAYYVHEASIRLFSPQTYFKEKKFGSLLITHDVDFQGWIQDGFPLSRKQPTSHAHGRPFYDQGLDSWLDV